MKLVLAAVALAASLATAGTAHAAPPPPPGQQGTEGAMSPALSDVTLVICTVPGSCPVAGK